MNSHPDTFDATVYMDPVNFFAGATSLGPILYVPITLGVFIECIRSLDVFKFVTHLAAGDVYTQHLIKNVRAGRGRGGVRGGGGCSGKNSPAAGGFGGSPPDNLDATRFHRRRASSWHSSLTSKPHRCRSSASTPLGRTTTRAW
jgi:hypothetical protein